jgi:2-amino-4-hydroxy-6-hydroxymethyldihydropteridine diphosphokinase
MAETAYILIGSNLGDREKNLKSAVEKMRSVEGLEIVATSSVYVSEAVDMKGENPSFLNQVIMIDYQYRPNELLDQLEAIEQALGRTDKGKKQPRTADLDILLFGNQTVNTDRLTIPHAKLLDRPFALIPMLEIDPELMHPVAKKPLAGFVNDKHREQVILYKDYVARNV